MLDPNAKFSELCRTRWRDRNGRSFGPRAKVFSGAERARFETIRQMAEESIQALRDPRLTTKLCPVYFDYIDNYELNALADVVERWGYVGVFRGTVEILHDLFNRLMSHPGVLPMVGTASRESVNPQHSESRTEYFDEVTEVRKMEGRAIETIEPIDPTRRAFARWLWLAACHFLIHHEFAHITQGHVAFAARKSGVPFILEANVGSNGGMNELTRQAIESYADEEGAYQSFAFLLQVTEFGLESHFGPRISQFHAMLAWHISIHSLFHFWGLRLDTATIGQQLYPPTLIRYSQSVEKARQCCHTHWPHLEAEFDIVWRNSATLLIQAMRLIGAPPVDVQSLEADRADPNLLKYIQGLHDRKQALLNDLAP